MRGYRAPWVCSPQIGSTMKIASPLLALVSVTLLAAPALAHLELEDPPSRYGPGVQKSAPCGMGDGPRSENVTTFRPGQTITVRWNEFINHPGHYRISFDPDGQDDFQDPACLAECDNGNMEIELYTNEAVLLDGIEDRDGGDYSAEITLPDIECDNCTLQVVQVMTDKPPYTLGGNDLYYQCADLILANDAPGDDMGGGELDIGITPEPDMGTPPPPVNNSNPPPIDMNPDPGQPMTNDTGTEADTAGSFKNVDGGSSCSTTGAIGSTSWTLLLLGALRLRRRRRAHVVLR